MFQSRWLLLALVWACWLGLHEADAQEPDEPTSRANQPPATQPRRDPPAPNEPNPNQPNASQPRTTRPNANQPRPPARTPAPSPDSLSLFNLASIPNMLGDTSGGGCGALTLQGNIAATIEHPTFACSRLNISENNRAITTDRAYWNYRHFHNASFIDIFSFAPLGGQNSLPIDRHTFGIEKTIGCAASVELRVPINRQLSSDLPFSQVQGVAELPLDDVDSELGNLAVIYKRQLYQRPNFYFSGGVAVNIPTAPDVSFSAFVMDNNFQIIDPNTGQVIAVVPVDYNLSAQVRNETVNLSPFLAYAWVPTPVWFSQGFFQIDVPLNESGGRIEQSLTIAGIPFPDVLEGARIGQQTLMRINFGFGRWLIRKSPCDALLHSLAVMFEFHYTSTLNDSDVAGPLVVAPDVGTGETVLFVGNLGNRVDVVNFAFGIPAAICAWNVTNGVVFPLRDGDDRGFDVEYNFTLERRF